MKTITGDLLAIESGVIVHQVNCRGVTGGLAGALRRKWPQQFDEYIHDCRVAGSKNIGNFTFSVGEPGPAIVHLFGQVDPGANTDLEAVESGLKQIARNLRRDRFYKDAEIFAPYLMGCGLGGGRWDEYLPLLEKHLPQLTLVKLPA